MAAMFMDDEIEPKTVDTVKHRQNLDCVVVIHGYISDEYSIDIKELCPTFTGLQGFLSVSHGQKAFVYRTTRL